MLEHLLSSHEFPHLLIERVGDFDFQPFQIIGVDYAGPFQVNESHGTTKVYVLLFTCTRLCAIHLEVVRTMTTDTFVPTIAIY